ncbi:MAG: YIP1 family protein, partial [Myxococcota bacterium]
ASKRHYAFESAQIEGDEAVARVRQHLLWTFPDQSPENIDRALARRPVRFTTATTPENAGRLLLQLERMGARVMMTDLSAPAGDAPAGGAPEASAPEAVSEAPPAPGAAVSLPPGALPEPAEVSRGAATERPSAAPATFPGEPEEAGKAESAAEAGPPAFFWTAWTEAVFSPVTFFASLRAPGGTMQALLFAAVLGLLAMILSFPATMLALFDQGALERSELAERYLTELFTQPLVTVLAVCFTGWLFHLGLRIVAGHRPFDVTLKVVAYTTAAAVFAAIPKAGPLIASFLALLLTLIGLSSAQRISPIRALGAVVLPVLFLGGLVLLAAGSFMLGGYFILEALWS